LWRFIGRPYSQTSLQLVEAKDAEREAERRLAAALYAGDALATDLSLLCAEALACRKLSDDLFAAAVDLLHQRQFPVRIQRRLDREQACR
jgi:hypothetical protein